MNEQSFSTRLTIKELELEMSTDDLLTYLKEVVGLVDEILVMVKAKIEEKQSNHEA